jgi:hypothetical protein
MPLEPQAQNSELRHEDADCDWERLDSVLDLTEGPNRHKVEL